MAIFKPVYFSGSAFTNLEPSETLLASLGIERAEAHVTSVPPVGGQWSFAFGESDAAVYRYVVRANGQVLYRTFDANFLIYDQITESYSYSAQIPGHTQWSSSGVVLLANDKVLTVGGFDWITYLPSTICRVYDPTLDSWADVAPYPLARINVNLYQLPSGKVLAVGGVDGSYIPTADCYLYDPDLNTWTATGSLPTARPYLRAVQLPSGNVVVISGNTTGGWDSSTAECSLYNAITGLWDPAPALPEAVGQAIVGRFGNAAICIGGVRLDGITTNRVFSWAEGDAAWTELPSTVQPLYGPYDVAELADGRLLLTGEAGGFELFQAGAWFRTTAPWANVSGSPAIRQVDGRVLLGGNTPTLIWDVGPYHLEEVRRFDLEAGVSILGDRTAPIKMFLSDAMPLGQENPVVLQISGNEADAGAKFYQSGKLEIGDRLELFDRPTGRNVGYLSVGSYFAGFSMDPGGAGVDFRMDDGTAGDGRFEATWYTNAGTWKEEILDGNTGTIEINGTAGHPSGSTYTQTFTPTDIYLEFSTSQAYHDLWIDDSYVWVEWRSSNRTVTFAISDDEVPVLRTQDGMLLNGPDFWIGGASSINFEDKLHLHHAAEGAFTITSPSQGLVIDSTVADILGFASATVVQSRISNDGAYHIADAGFYRHMVELLGDPATAGAPKLRMSARHADDVTVEVPGTIAGIVEFRANSASGGTSYYTELRSYVVDPDASTGSFEIDVRGGSVWTFIANRYDLYVDGLVVGSAGVDPDSGYFGMRSAGPLAYYADRFSLYDISREGREALRINSSFAFDGGSGPAAWDDPPDVYTVFNLNPYYDDTAAGAYGPSIRLSGQSQAGDPLTPVGTPIDYATISAWPKENKAASSARSWVTLNGVVAGDNLNIGGYVFTAVIADPQPLEFVVGADDTESAVNLAAAVNIQWSSTVSTTSSGNRIDLLFLEVGPSGNGTYIDAGGSGHFTIPSGAFYGGSYGIQGYLGFAVRDDVAGVSGQTSIRIEPSSTIGFCDPALFLNDPALFTVGLIGPHLQIATGTNNSAGDVRLQLQDGTLDVYGSRARFYLQQHAGIFRQDTADPGEPTLELNQTNAINGSAHTLGAWGASIHFRGVDRNGTDVPVGNIVAKFDHEIGDYVIELNANQVVPAALVIKSDTGNTRWRVTVDDLGVITMVQALSPLAVYGLSQTTGLEAGGDELQLYGDYFTTNITVEFGVGNFATIESTDRTWLEFLTPPGSGTVDVIVTNPDGSTVTLPAAFTYV